MLLWKVKYLFHEYTQIGLRVIKMFNFVQKLFQQISSLKKSILKIFGLIEEFCT